jgi:hypothetical protein
VQNGDIINEDGNTITETGNVVVDSGNAIVQSGALGVGTSSPATAIDVQKADPRLKLTETDQTGNTAWEVGAASKSFEVSQPGAGTALSIDSDTHDATFRGEVNAPGITGESNDPHVSLVESDEAGNNTWEATSSAREFQINQTNVGTALAVEPDSLNVNVPAALTAGEIDGPWISPGSGNGYVRLGDVQIVWGGYLCSASASPVTTFPNEIGTSSPVAFSETYRVIATPQTDLSRSATAYTLNPTNVIIRTWTTNTAVKSGACGSYVAIGRWR